MTYLERMMARNEKIVLISRQHWIALFSRIWLYALLALGALILAAASPFSGPLAPLVAPLALIALIILGGIIAYFYLQWYNEQYVITNRRVVQIEGVYNKHTSDSSLEKVNDVVMEQSALGRLLDFGNIEIITGSDVGVNNLRLIASPVRFKTEMLNQKEALGAMDDFSVKATRVLQSPAPAQGDIPELIAELDELRKKGIITEQEFQLKKADLLARL
jgi:uncharacterized membrane protein YdbT with pleckstrin-like domain